MNRTLFVAILLVLGCASSLNLKANYSLQGDIITEISNYFRAGDSKELSKHLSSTVNLSLMDSENVYSKAQAEIILNNFFKGHAPQGVKIVHRLDNNSTYQHAVILLSTSKGDFRIAFSLKGDENQLQLIEIRIESAS